MPDALEDWQRFDEGRRSRIEEALQSFLAKEGREEGNTAALVAALEWAAGNAKREPWIALPDTERYAAVPLKIARQAKALKRAIANPIPEGYPVAHLKVRPDEWRAAHSPEDLLAFERILESLASEALSRAKPVDMRLSYVEGTVLRILQRAGLPWEGIHAADILAEVKEHSLEKRFPEKATARLKALADAVRRVRANGALEILAGAPEPQR